MPYRKTIFANDYYYHIYNRGVEKRIIFQNQQDYCVFLEIMAYYLIPDSKIPKIFSRKPKERIPHSISLLSYCLMPNHFHLLLQQKKNKGIQEFMHAIGVTYSMYFNKKYQRVGSLFQGRFKAKMVDKDEYLLHLSKYIHLNPSKNPATYAYSSYQYYLHSIAPKEFIDTTTILSYFSNKHKNFTYQKFVEEIPLDIEYIDPYLF